MTCLSSIKTRNFTLRHVFNSFFLTGSVCLRISSCFYSRSYSMLLSVYWLLLTACSFTLFTLFPALNNCYYLLLPGVTVVSCRNISCCNLSPVVITATVLIFHHFLWLIGMLTSLTRFHVYSVDMLTCCCCWHLMHWHCLHVDALTSLACWHSTCDLLLCWFCWPLTGWQLMCWQLKRKWLERSLS